MSLPIFACVSAETVPNCIELDSELVAPDSTQDMEKLMTMGTDSVESDGRRLRYLPIIGITYNNTMGKSQFKGNVEKLPLSWKDYLLPKQFDDQNMKEIDEFHSKRPALLYDAFSETRHTVRCDVGVTMLDKEFYKITNAGVDWEKYYYGKYNGVNFVKSNVIPLSDDTKVVSITPFAIHHFGNVMDLVDCSKIRVQKTDIANTLGATFTDQFKSINNDNISTIYHDLEESKPSTDKLVTMSDWMARLSENDKKMDLTCRLNFNNEKDSDLLASGCLTTQLDARDKVISAQLVCEHRTCEIVNGVERLSKSLNIPKEQEDYRLWAQHYDSAMLRCVSSSYVTRKLYNTRKLSSTLAYVMLCEKLDRFWGVNDGLVQKTYDSLYADEVQKKWSDRAISEDENLEAFYKLFANILDDTVEGKELFVRTFSSGIRLGEYVAHTVIKGEPSEIADMRSDRLRLIFDLMVENCVVEKTVDDVLTNSNSKVIIPDFFENISSVLKSEKDQIPTLDDAVEKLSLQVECEAMSALCGKVTTQWLQHCYVKRDLFAPSPGVLKSSGAEFQKNDNTDIIVSEKIANDVTYAYKNALSAYTNALRLSGNNVPSSQRLGMLTFVKTMCHRTLVRNVLGQTPIRPRNIFKTMSDIYRLSTFPYGKVRGLFVSLVGDANSSLDAVSQWFQDRVQNPSSIAKPVIRKVVGDILDTIRLLDGFSKSAEVTSTIATIVKDLTANMDPPYDDIFFKDIKEFCNNLCTRPEAGGKAKYWNYNRKHDTYPQTNCVAMGAPGLDPVPLMRVARLIRNATDGVFTFGVNAEEVFDDFSLSFGNGQTLVAMCKIKSADKANLERTLSPVAKERLKNVNRYAIYGCDLFVPDNHSWRPYAFVPESKKSSALPETKKSSALSPHDTAFELWTSLEFTFAPKTLHLISDKSRSIMYDGITYYDTAPNEKDTNTINATMSMEYCKRQIFEALSVSKKAVELYPMPMIPNIYMGDATYELTAKYNILKEGIKCIKYVSTLGVANIAVPSYLRNIDNSSLKSSVEVNIRDIYKRLLIDKSVVKSALESLALPPVSTDDGVVIRLEWHEGTTYFGERSKICDADALVDGAMLSGRSDGKLTVTLFAVKRYPNHTSRVAKEALEDIKQGLANKNNIFSEYALNHHRLEKDARLRLFVEQGLITSVERKDFIDASCAYDSGYGLSFGPLAEYKCALDCDAPDPNYEMGSYVVSELATPIKYSELCDKIAPRSSFSSASDLVSVYKVVVVTISKVSNVVISETLSVKQDKVCFRDVLSNNDDGEEGEYASPNYRGRIFSKTFGFLSERFYFDTKWFEPIKIVRLSTVVRNSAIEGPFEHYKIFGNFLRGNGAVDFPKYALSGCLTVGEHLKKVNVDGGLRFETLCRYFEGVKRNGDVIIMDDNYGEFEGFEHDIVYKRTDKRLNHAQKYLDGLKTLIESGIVSHSVFDRNPEMVHYFVDLDMHFNSLLHFDSKTKSSLGNKILKKYLVDQVHVIDNVGSNDQVGSIDGADLQYVGSKEDFLTLNSRKIQGNYLSRHNGSMLLHMLTLSATRGFDEGCLQYSQALIDDDAKTGLTRKATMSGIFWENRETERFEPLIYLYGTETFTFNFDRDLSKMTQRQKGFVSERLYRRTARLIYEAVRSADNTVVGVSGGIILSNILKSLGALISVSILPPTRLVDQITGLKVRVDANEKHRSDFPISFDGRFSIAQMRVFVNDRAPKSLAKMFPSSEDVMTSEPLRDEIVRRASTHAKNCDNVFKLTPNESYDILAERLVEKTAKPILMSVSFEYTKIMRKGDVVVESQRCDAKCFERFPFIDTLRVLLSTLDAMLNTLKDYQNDMGVNTSGYDPLLLFSNIMNGAFELYEYDYTSSVTKSRHHHNNDRYYSDRLLDEKTLALLCLSSHFDCWVSPTTKREVESPDITVSKTSAVAASKKYDNLQWLGVYSKDYLTCPWSRNTSVSLLETYLIKLKAFYTFLHSELKVSCRAFAAEAYEKSLVSSGFLDRNDSGDVMENVSAYMSARRSAFESSFLTTTRRGFQTGDPRFNGTGELGVVLIDLDFEDKNTATSLSKLESMEKICENYTLVEWINLFEFVGRRDRKIDYRPSSQEDCYIVVFDDILETSFSDTKHNRHHRRNFITTSRDYWIAKAFSDTISSKIQININYSITATLSDSSDESHSSELASLSVAVSEGYSFDAVQCLSSLLELTEKKYFGGQSELPHLAFLNHNWKMLSPTVLQDVNTGVLFDTRCLELWLNRGEYTVNKYWYKAFKKAAVVGGTWEMDTLVVNNMFVVERFIYPLFEELLKYKTEDYHRTETLNSYARDVMFTLKTLHVQMLNNVYTEVIHR